MKNYRSSNDVKKTGAEDLLSFYMGKLSEGMEELSKNSDDQFKENKITDFGVEQFPVGFRPYNGIWRYEPVSSSYFCDKFLGEKPTPKQQEFLDIVCGVDPFEVTNLDYVEAYFMWGKGSGKDTTAAKCFAYQGYKFACLTDPQTYLGLGRGSPVDMVNIASNSEQAKKIFFKYLINFVKLCKDPETGYNWFATKNFWFDQGSRVFRFMDLRERDGDIKIKEIDFCRGITCHSLTSDRFTAEGLTIVLAVMDEVGAMRPENVFGTKDGKDSKAIGQLKSLGTSVRRSSKFGKLMCISYKYGRNCPMSILVRKFKLDPTVYVRTYSVYEVRTDKNEEELRKQFAKDYVDDLDLAKMVYECKDPEMDSDTFISNPYIIRNCVDAAEKFAINPFKNKLVICSDISAGVDGLLEPWFKGNENYYYAIHADLAKGQVWKGGDAIGLAMGHLQEMRVTYDKAWVDYYMKTYQVDLSEFQGKLRIGVVMDLLLQIICTSEQKEARIMDIREFMIQLQARRKFGLIKVTMDRWGSEETIQELNRSGIESEILSMDKSYNPWHTTKDYMQQGVLKFYEHKVLERELSELVDTGKKIDHPELSMTRMELEGVSRGSKDVADSVAGVTYTLVKELVDGGGIFLE